MPNVGIAVRRARIRFILMNPRAEFSGVEILLFFLYFRFGFGFRLFVALEYLHLGVLGIQDFREGRAVACNEFDNGGLAVVGELPRVGEDVRSTAGSGFGGRQGGRVLGWGEHGALGIGHCAGALEGDDGGEALMNLARVNFVLLGESWYHKGN